MFITFTCSLLMLDSVFRALVRTVGTHHFFTQNASASAWIRRPKLSTLSVLTLEISESHPQLEVLGPPLLQFFFGMR